MIWRLTGGLQDDTEPRGDCTHHPASYTQRLPPSYLTYSEKSNHYKVVDKIKQGCRQEAFIQNALPTGSQS